MSSKLPAFSRTLATREAAWPAITGENGAEGKGEARAAGGNRQTVDRRRTVGLANLEIHKKRKKKK